MNAEVIKVTPELAESLLNRNERNRPCDQDHVKHLVYQMQSGQFNSLNGQTIVLSRNGELLDGQHRLRAIVKCGIQFPFLIVKGADDDSFKTIDTGKRRSIGDIFAIDNITNYRNLSASILFYVRMCRSLSQNSTMNKVKISNQDLLNKYYENPDFFQTTHTKGQKLYKKVRLVPLAALSGMMFYTLLHSIHKNRAYDDFWEPLVIGGDGVGKVVTICRERLISEGLKIRQAPSNHKLAWIVISYNAHFSGKDLKIIKWDAERQSFPAFD